ncbi:sigma-E factor negative regulatory protein [Polaromonas sp.]|uniref:sigma-E factor negative regulatory protein n=1 Tax=Polaromonas sp. TaxID=1869339 RepID=UPI003354CFF6
MNTMKSSTQTCELLSALADGELGREEIAVVLQSCRQDEAVVANWNAYHLIGDVLRSPAPAKRGADMAFLDRLNQRIAQEKTQAPPAVAEAPTAGKLAPGLIRHRAPAANDGSFRWKLVAGFASMAAVATIAWNAAGQLGSSPAPQLAQGPSSQQQQVIVASPQGPMVRDARLEELLAAHRELGSTSALQVPSGFLRNATFETPQNAGR